MFSVKKVNTYCFNMDVYGEGKALSDEVLRYVDVKGKSVFLLDDKKIIAGIEKNVADVKVINIEREFPDRVTVNFVKMYNYFRVRIGEKYYLSRCDGRVTEPPLDTLPAGSHIEIRSGITGEFTVGQFLFSSSNGDFLAEAVTAFECLGIEEHKASVFFEFIDIYKKEQEGIVYIGVRGGGVIKILGRDNFLHKLRMGLSAYNEKNPGKDMMITVSGANKAALGISDYNSDFTIYGVI